MTAGGLALARQAAARAQQRLYADVLTAWGWTDVRDGALTRPQRTLRYEELPCRLSRVQVPAPGRREDLPLTQEEYVLHTAPDVALQANDDLEVRRLGETLRGHAGKTHRYATHCETAFVRETAAGG